LKKKNKRMPLLVLKVGSKDVKKRKNEKSLQVTFITLYFKLRPCDDDLEGGPFPAATA
jgi:hypothetical protein